MITDSLRLMVGGDKCNAKCPYCVTKMVENHSREARMNWKRFHIACNYAIKTGATTVILGGTGEPTLYPECITDVLENLMPYNFPLIELQTNGVLLSNKYYDENLRDWSNKGLSRIQVSIVDYEDKVNSKIMNKPQYNLSELISKLHSLDYSVRLSCIIFREGIDTTSKLETLINESLRMKADQLLLSPLIIPFQASGSVLEWVKNNTLSVIELNNLINYLDAHGTKILKNESLTTYDVRNQNVALMNTLDYDPLKEENKHLVLYPNGRLSYDRRFKGSVIL